MKTRGSRKTAILAGVTAAILTTSAAQAVELNYAFGFAPGADVSVAAEEYAAAVEERSGGDVTVRLFPMSLLNLLETGPGLRDGLADIGYVLAPYYAAEYAHYSLVAELNMTLNLSEPTGKESLAYAGAITEYAFTKCPECLEEFERQNQVYMGGATSSLYILLCNKPVANITDLNGKRIRAGSPSFSRFAEHFKAVGIQMSANEVYEGLSQGVIDCAMLSAPELTNYSLLDVVTDVTLGVPGGVYAGAAVGNINLDAWRGLTDDQRAALVWGASLLSADITWNYYSSDARALAAAREKGINIMDADPTLVEELRKFVAADQEVIADIYTKNYNVTRAEEILAEFRPVLERWNGLVQDVETKEQLRDLFWEEIFSKVDPSTHGM